MVIRNLLSTLLLLTTASSLFASLDARAEKRALIVTIGEYESGTGWSPISSDRDLPLMEYALKRQGFAQNRIHHLSGPEATREGIEKAIRDHLIDPATSGDVVVFHYSGHGQQITDNNRDELDGYDESLVPFDALESPPPGYDGAKHLRDDQFGDLLYELRRKIGPTGDVLVFLDSCYSGTATRGAEYPDSVRGSTNPIGPPQQQDGQQLESDHGSGFSAESALSQAPDAVAPGALAPMVVISAETHNRLAEETTDDDGENVGALSWALSRALADAGDQTSYRDLFENVKRRTVAKDIPNSPQAEGELDRMLFAGQAVNQDPFFRVREVNLDGGWAVLEGGGLVGLLPGSVVEIHKVGTRVPSADTLIAVGEILSATPFTAEMKFSKITDANAETGWAFVTEQVFGSLKINVYIDAPPNSAWDEAVRTAFAQEAAKETSLIMLLDARPIGLVSSDATKIVHIREITEGPPSKRGIMLESWKSGQQLLSRPIQPSSGTLASQLIRRIKVFAQNSYLRSLDVKVSDMQVELDIIPCKLQCTSELRVCGGEECSCIEEGDPADFLDEGNDIRMALGTGFGVRLKNTGTTPVYATILDLMPDGSMGLLWPLAGTSEVDTLLKEGSAYRIPDPRNRDRLLAYRACPPFGADMLKIIATTEPVDFGPITRGTRTRGGARGPLDVLFEESLEGTRGFVPTFEVGSVSTSDMIITVEEPE